MHRVIARNKKRRERDTPERRQRTCRQCGTQFSVRKGFMVQPFCSWPCSRDYRIANNPERKRLCPICGESFAKFTRSEPLRKTCGKRECTAEFVRRKTRSMRPCKRCKTAFWPVRQTSGKFETYCSRECYDDDRKQIAWLKLKCAECHASVERLRSARQYGRVFCSAECQQKHLSGENHPLYRGNADPNRGVGWRKRAEEARLRDGYKCLRCGKTQEENGDKLAVDHLVPWRVFENKKDANDLSNLASLCKACHGYKTTKIERAWLRGDVLLFKQFVESLYLPSARWSQNADGAA